MLPVDEWHDWLRLANLIVSFACVCVLGHRFSKRGNSWNVKTKDYWFALVMWCVAGSALAIEGIYRDSPPGARLAFLFIASAVTLKGLLRGGAWGSSEN